jgi:hypothetical protein
MKIQDLTFGKVKDYANVLGATLTVGPDGFRLGGVRLAKTNQLEGVTVYSVHQDLTDVVKTLNMMAETTMFNFEGI